MKFKFLYLTSDQFNLFSGLADCKTVIFLRIHVQNDRKVSKYMSIQPSDSVIGTYIEVEVDHEMAEDCIQRSCTSAGQ